MQRITSTNPGRNYEVVGGVAATTTSEIVRQVRLANEAKEGWRLLGVDSRIVHLRRVLEICKRRAKEIAQIITKEVGTPITASKEEIDWSFGYFNWFLENARQAIAPQVVGQDDVSIHTIYFEPIGTAAVITPWNLPFDLFLWGVIPNLLVGNTVIYKAAEECVLTGALFENIMEEAQLPKGVFSSIHGAAKEGAFLLNQNIDLIWFTGSTNVGQKIYSAAGKKFIKPILEMGGSNPAIIFEDADIDKAIAGVLSKRFMFCGQTCDADKRLIVHASIAQDVIARLQKKVEEFVLGDPEDAKTTMGPLVSKKQLDLLVSQVADAVKKGAIIITGAKKPSHLHGAYYCPTILTNIHPSMRVWTEEVFGPVLPIVTFTTEEEAIRLANDTEFGLGSQIYTRDENRIQRMISAIQAGNVDVNAVGHFRPYDPFGGYKKSGMGREHGIVGFQELCQIKIVSKPVEL
jgi:acyl-CoA reductase-like NAD-dependent aldehyde dehydrogenase